MKYSLQCKYSMVQQTFMFVIKSLQNINYDFTWLVGNLDKPLYVLTNNNIIFKAQVEDDFVVFSVAKSDKPLNEKLNKTMTVPVLTFETDEEQLEILYDYDHLPNEKDIFVGKIINQFLVVAGGSFLETTDDYDLLENNIASILDEYSKQNKKTSNVKNKTTKQQQSKKSSETIEKIQAKTTTKKRSKKTANNKKQD